MADTRELSRGMIIKYNNEPHILVEKVFYSPGKGGAFNKVKLKNIRSGKFVNTVYRSEEKVEELEVSKSNMQYIYADETYAYFMNPQTFDQMSVNLEVIPGKLDFLHEESKYVMTIYEDAIIYVELPPKMTLLVTETTDAVKGDTATNASKDATLETGVMVKVPLFIKNGDKVIINTEDGTYFSKA